MNVNPGDFLLLLARNSAAAGVLVLLVLLAQRLCGRQVSPHWRCALWFVVAVRLLPLSFSSPVSIFNFLPGDSAPSAGVALVIENAGRAASADAPPGPAPDQPGFTLDGVTDTAPTDAMLTSAAQISRFLPLSWTTAVLSIWGAGVLALALYVIGSTVALRRQIGRANIVRDQGVLSLLNSCGEEMGVRRVPVVAESAAVSTPALCGLFRPRLLLPSGFTESFSAAELRFVFLHELAHLRRHDLPLNWLMTGLQMLHWFNPLVWYGFARWRVDREIACDAAALQASGAHSTRAYGLTMLRLLQNFSQPRSRPGLVGILEDPRQLRRRMSMIAKFTPARRPYLAAGILAILALVGLTDAQVTPSAVPAASSADKAAPTQSSPIPSANQPYVLFLVNASETMLSTPNAIQPQEIPGPQKGADPKWNYAIHALEESLQALAPGTGFHVALYFDQTLESVGGRAAANDHSAIARTITRIRQVTPRGQANLEVALTRANDPSRFPLPERLVLITDGLPTAGESLPGDATSTELQRIHFFQSALQPLRPRLPVHTVLVPSSVSDAAAAGLHWQLAVATGGGLTTQTKLQGEAPTHLAFVIDTSGSMRDPNTGKLWPGVIDAIDATLDANPQLEGVQLVDADGRFILPRRGVGSGGWQPATRETRETIDRTMRTYQQDTVSNPIPGVLNALRFLRDRASPTTMRMSIYVLGDEFNSSEPASTALDGIAAFNPADANGRRPVTINAIGFPTTVRAGRPMGNTGLRYANLMRQLAEEHGGSFVALPQL